MKGETSGRLIGIGDIHGCYDLLTDLVEHRIIFNPLRDRLVFLGDYIDRGRHSREVVDYLSDLRKHYPQQIVLLKGNHEEMAFNALSGDNIEKTRPDAHMLWFFNGGLATINSYKEIAKAREALLPFIRSLEYYYETETHIFVHAGIPYSRTLETVAEDELLWDRSFSYQGQKTLVVGHTPRPEVVRLGNIVCLDTGAYMTGILSAYDVLSNSMYQAKAA
jgi:serine/threonine protein phosphatase 1